jgi:hypothetical protein
MTFQIVTYKIDDEALKNLSNRRRNQLFGCMHAHNELTFLEEALGRPLGDPDDVTNVEGAPTADKIGLPPWLEIRPIQR